MDFLFNLNRGDKRGLQKQLRDQISASILNGHIAPDSLMPSSRKLADQLGIARNTVMLAYASLQDDGYLVSRERSGYFVNPKILENRVTKKTSASQATPASEKTVDWDEKLTWSMNPHRIIVKPDNWRDFKFCFVYGQLDPKLFPVRHWRECWKDAVGVQEISDWSQDLVDKDDPLLVDQIRSRLLTRRGLWVEESQILVTVGAQNALYMAMRLLLNRDRTFGIEEPGYPDARNIASQFTQNIHGLPVDTKGLVLSDAIKECDLVYVTPSHQSPTTVTMPMSRRKKLIQLAEEHDFLILEDDYEAEVSFSEAPLPALMSYDNKDRVIYIGSLSKTLAPGLRLGYVVGPERFIRQARALRRLIMRHPPANNQRAAAYFLDRGYHESLLRALVKSNQEKWAIVSNLLNTTMPEMKAAPNRGGSSFWVTGPKSMSAREFAASCMDDSVLIEPGDAHFLKKDCPRNHFRLGYTSIPVEKIKAGMEIVANKAKAHVQSL